MAGGAQRPALRRAPRPPGVLIALDGVSAAAIERAARRLAAARTQQRPGISRWDASGIFGDMAAAGPDVERASARTVLLLYAADLAFRLRWEIRPALNEGRLVIAAPYVDTAVALGRAVGIAETWVRSLFDFAPVADETEHVEAARTAKARGEGFIEFTCRHAAGFDTRRARQDVFDRARAQMKAVRQR